MPIFTFKPLGLLSIISSCLKLMFLGDLLGPGTVHHVAWNISDLDALKNYRQNLEQEKFSATSIIDRKYFKSIYLREPGKAIFEFATQGPGMTVDEKFEDLGKNLQLPQKYENRRAEILKKLNPLEDGGST